MDDIIKFLIRKTKGTTVRVPEEFLYLSRYAKRYKKELEKSFYDNVYVLNGTKIIATFISGNIEEPKYFCNICRKDLNTHGTPKIMSSLKYDLFYGKDNKNLESAHLKDAFKGCLCSDCAKEDLEINSIRNLKKENRELQAKCHNLNEKLSELHKEKTKSVGKARGKYLVSSILFVFLAVIIQVLWTK